MPELPTPPEPETLPPSGPPPSLSREDAPVLDSPAPEPGLPPTVPSDMFATLSEGVPGPQRPAYKTFGRYERLEQLARSAMGDVYKAWDSILKIDVALKTMQSSLPDEGSELAERFKREARALALLSHPHIVRIYDAGRHDGRAYFTMSFMTGGSLDRHTDRFGDPEAAVRLVEKVARAMQYVHEHGILHRDLKPANILLDEKGEPRVSDFGLAKFRDDEMEITHTGAVMGTFPYMAPEQARGRVDQFGPATDVWAMGVILYELLTRRRPFEAKSREAIASLICIAEPPPPRTLRPEVDHALETVILKCLEKQPEDRFSSAAVLADELGRWLAGDSILTRRLSVPVRLGRFFRRHAALTAVALLATLAGFLVLVSFWSSSANKPGYAVGEQERTTQTDQEILKRVRSQLDRGEAAELVPPRGLPGWYNRRVGNKMEILAAARPDADFVIKNFEPGALDLLPGSPRDSYRLRAEVCVVRQTKGSSAGIYVAAVEFAAPDGVADQWWVSLAFPYDATTVPKAALQLQRYRPTNGPAYLRDERELLRHPLPPDMQQWDWHNVQLDVSPQGISAYWEGMPVGTVAAAQIAEPLKQWAIVFANSPAPAQPSAGALLRGGLGLYNENAETWFRNVVVEPLP